MGSTKKIIREEIFSFINEFYGDKESSIADKWYEKNLGITPKKEIENLSPLDGEFIGMIMKRFDGNLFKNPPMVFKNPKSLKEFPIDARGILLSNGDFYLMMDNIALHDELLKFLQEKNVISSSVSKNYPKDYPDEYIAVDRDRYNNIFLPSYLYDSFPKAYERIFKLANLKNSAYKFYKSKPKSYRDVDEQMDMNRAFSFQPRDLDPNRNFGRPF